MRSSAKHRRARVRPGPLRPSLLAPLLALAALLLIAPSASATSYQRPLKEAFGPTEQPSFHQTEAIGINRKTGDVLVGDRGGNAQQKITFSGFAEGDQFTLANLPESCSAPSTEAIEFATHPESALAENTKAKLEERCGANFDVSGRASVGITVEFSPPSNAHPADDVLRRRRGPRQRRLRDGNRRRSAPPRASTASTPTARRRPSPRSAPT